MEFKNFQQAVAQQFALMSKNQLFRVDIERDDMYAAYLAAFPEGSNPIFRERTEHDCSCCRGFIKDVGNVVAIIKGKIVSLWDIKIEGEPEYQAVADALAAKVYGSKIVNPFFHHERTVGKDYTFEDLESGKRQRWNHFFANIPAQFVKAGVDQPSAMAAIRTPAEVFERALDELDPDAIETVLDLINQTPTGLYRGQDYKHATTEFAKLQRQYRKLKTATDRQIFVWANAATVNGAITGIRNTAIGSLLVDLSKGKELEAAVGAFENKVSGTNYKRPTALVTPKMIAAAKTKLEELGLLSSLARRHAVVRDLDINNLLYVNKATAKSIMGDEFDDLMSGVKTKASAKKFDKVEEVSIQNFIKNILPTAKGLEVMVENRHKGNLVTLVTASDPTAGQLFQWDNPFSWSYAGGVADSIKERVKAAGGQVEGDLCCRLAWNYRDDLDFYMTEPDGSKIYFSNRRQLSSNGGMLDLDANGIDGQRDDPAENIFYKDKSKMREGIYKLSVNNYSRRSDGAGFEVEIEFDGQTTNIVYDKVVATGAWVHVADIEYTKSGGFRILKSLPSATVSKPMSGINTQQFTPVRAVSLSPNYWSETGEGRGNKHFFFFIEGMVFEEPARGIYNEFLRSDLTAHRKVFEVLGSKIKVEEQQDQLTGLGFSETKADSFVVRVTGTSQRIFKVIV